MGVLVGCGIAVGTGVGAGVAADHAAVCVALREFPPQRCVAEAQRCVTER